MYSVGIAYLLWLVGFGALGLHRFYLGKIPTGILWLLTGGLGMVGSIYDLITIPSQVRAANMRNAHYNQARKQRGAEKTAEEPEGNWRYANDAEYRTVTEDRGE